MRAHEFLYEHRLNEDVENFPIANVRRPNGAIGNQGVNTNQAADVLTHAAGMQVSPDWTMRQLVDALKADPAAQQRLRQFVQKNPVTVYALPDGSYHLQDGHHRTFLLNLLGDQTVPAIVKEDVKEAKTVEFEGLTLKVIKQGHELVVDALDDWGNKVLGHVKFNIGDDKELDPQDLHVDEKYQGQGIARVMYDYVKSLGYTINRSWDQTDAGRGFWDKHRGEDVRVWENFADGKNPGRRGLAKHLIRESASEREIAQAQYMQGECAVLALTIHKMDPQRFPLGFVYEFFDAMPDMYIEPDEFDELDPAQQQDIQYNHKNWTLTHAYVYDVKTKEYIDAEGRHNQLPTIGRDFNATRHNKFPAEVQDLVRVSHYMEWDEAQEEWIVLSGWDALNKAYTPEGQQRAREYAIKYLGIDRPAQDVAENFADGKNPGRKGLSKRVGVNTKASVSSLRKTAKNSSGEKQRMAHWLANMKAGRAKKNK